MMPLYIASGAGVLLFFLGFVALLSQKIYMDSHTKSPVEIEIPVLGKMKANYPALAFVFLGSFLVFYGVYRYEEKPRLVRWHIDGTFVNDAHAPVNLQEGDLTVFPASIENSVDPETGRFTIDLPIEEGKTFEEVIELVDYSHKKAGASFEPKLEMVLFNEKKPSRLLRSTSTTRTYSIPLQTRPH